MTRVILVLPILCSLAGCLTGAPFGGDDDDDGGDDDVVDPIADDGCPPMYRQDVVPEYHLDFAPSEWTAIQDEFRTRREREAAGLDPEPYHPAQFSYVLGDERGGPVPNVLVRLKGGSSWLQALDLDTNPKMQFVIAFNEVDPSGRWKGVRKLELDMPRTDASFIKQRLALVALREAGVPAQCANNARLFVNGEYYGLYTNLERLDKEFIQRVFPEADDGDLWKGGYQIKTNEETFDPARINALWDATDVAQIDALADLDASMYEWAAEAMVGDADGYYNGRANFFLYDHPTRGFIWLPHDVDTAFDKDFLPADATPIYPACLNRWESDWQHYLIAMADPAARERYVAKLVEVRGKYDADRMQERVEQWSEQIAQAAADDPHRPFSMDLHYDSINRIAAFTGDRAAYLDQWLSCRERGNGPDGDGDGVDMCNDCDDRDPLVRPGAQETCNLRDDDCDGRVDTIQGATVCQ